MTSGGLHRIQCSEECETAKRSFNFCSKPYSCSPQIDSSRNNVRDASHFVMSWQSDPMQAVGIRDLDRSDLDPGASTVRNDIDFDLHWLGSSLVGRFCFLFNSWCQWILKHFTQGNNAFQVLSHSEFSIVICKVVLEPLQLINPMAHDSAPQSHLLPVVFAALAKWDPLARLPPQNASRLPNLERPS